MSLAGEKRQLVVAHLLEARVLLTTVRVDVVLDLGHQELTNTQETRARGELVAERVTNGRRCKGHLAVVVLEQVLERKELALGGLGAQESGLLAGGTDLSLEHEVDGNRRLDLVAGDRAADVVLLDKDAHVLTSVVVKSGQKEFVLLANLVVELDSTLGSLLGLLLLLGVVNGLLNLLATGLLVGLQASLEHILDQVIGTQNLASLGVLAHEVGELVDVARGLEDVVRGDHSALEFLHALLTDEVVTPDGQELSLEGGEGVAIVEETLDRTVGLKGLPVEVLALHQRLESGSVKFLTRLGLVVCGHSGLSSCVSRPYRDLCTPLRGCCRKSAELGSEGVFECAGSHVEGEVGESMRWCGLGYEFSVSRLDQFMCQSSHHLQILACGCCPRSFPARAS